MKANGLVGHQKRWEYHMSIKKVAIVATLGVAAIAVGTMGTPSFASDHLTVLNWKGWGTDAPFAIAKSKEISGNEAVHDYISSFAESFTKLRTNPGAYDLMDLNVAFTKQAADEGLIQPIDVSRLKNFEGLEPNFRNSAEIDQDSKVWGVAWIWGASTLAYDTEKFANPPDTLAALWDPANAGQVCWKDDAEDSVRFTALLLGQDPDAPSDMAAIGAKLRELKPQIKALWKTEDEWLKLVAAKQCALSIIWTTSVEIAKDQNKLPVSFVIPKEGAIVWRDALSIAKDAPNLDQAYAFIDYLISPEFFAEWNKAGGAPVAGNMAAVDQLSDNSLTKKVLTEPDALKRLNVKGNLTDEQRQAMVDLWQETKASYAQ
jgi:spermidine/putrescine transport system substrate-binding protein